MLKYLMAEYAGMVEETLLSPDGAIQLNYLTGDNQSPYIVRDISIQHIYAGLKDGAYRW